MTDFEVGEAVAPGSAYFALHTLGWRAFQDLCAVVLRQLWGQSVVSFADSNDAGRDGAFYGNWGSPGSDSPSDMPQGPFVLQCKHTKSTNATLSLSMLSEEFDKVSELVRSGLCGTYVLMTNARVTGMSESAIRGRLIECGVAHPVVFDGQWISDAIAMHRDLRRFIPRVYGLGDLSQIIDERAYEQARVLLAPVADQVSSFVATSAYHKAIQALTDHGFVLLLGEPGVGKSAIALMLALYAADSWGSLPIKARSSEQVAQHWNPLDTNQFFWVDDAFGVVRYEERRAEEWSRDLPQIMCAVNTGTRVVLTSRTYIYREARPLLKEYSYPLLHEQQVVVDIADITTSERRQIIYNHLAAGDQPREVRRQMKPLLECAAEVEPFRPEAARRLGLRAFTRNLAIDGKSIASFIANPSSFLDDIYGQLGANSRAALALVYISSHGGLPSTLRLNKPQRELVAGMGATVGGIGSALQALGGTFLREEMTESRSRIWTFRHPTLREGFASFLSRQDHLMYSVVAAIDDNALITETDCLLETDRQHGGTSLRIPPPLFRSVAKRLAAMFREWPEGSCWTGDATRYLAREASNEMLEAYISVDPDLPERLADFSALATFVPEPRLLARFHSAGLLSERHRRMAMNRMAHLAITALDTAWLEDEAWKVLLTEEDRSKFYAHVREMLVPMLDRAVEERWGEDAFWRGGEDHWRGTEDPRRAGRIWDALNAYRDAFAQLGEDGTADLFGEAARLSQDRFAETEPTGSPWSRRGNPPQETAPRTPGSARSTFSDLDE